VIATPYAKQLAKDLRVDLATVAGTGPNGRITASDVERTAKGGAAPAPAAPAAAAPAATGGAPAAAAPAPAKAAAATTVAELRGTTKPFTTLQAAVARNMNESLKVRLWCAEKIIRAAGHRRRWRCVWAHVHVCVRPC
jgi:pyruvate dehydrogenase E2 component (dihydrolipoamide acetyltransferase)